MGKASGRKKSRIEVDVAPMDFSDYDVVDRSGEQWLLLRKSTGLYYIHHALSEQLAEVPGWEKIIGDKFGGFIFGVHA